LLVGPVESSQRDSVKNHIDKLRRTLPVQIILRDDLILDRDIQPYFHLADVVLATYQHHMGMSSILVRAAQARKPVLASSYGLLGEIVNRRDLGLTIDSTRPQEIARGIRTFISEECNVAFDPNQALAFAHENSAEQFAHTLFKYLF
jgi:glycosyltransferase involved in cell wall biosynthesis